MGKELLRRQVLSFVVIPRPDDDRIGIDFPDLKTTVEKTVVDAAVFDLRQIEDLANLTLMRIAFQVRVLFRDGGGIQDIGVLEHPVLAEI